MFLVHAPPAVKRLIGKSYVEVEQDAGQLSYAVAADDDGFVVLECPQLAAAAADGASAGDGGEEEEGAIPDDPSHRNFDAVSSRLVEPGRQLPCARELHMYVASARRKQARFTPEN